MRRFEGYFKFVMFFKGIKFGGKLMFKIGWFLDLFGDVILFMLVGGVIMERILWFVGFGVCFVGK